MVKEKSNTSLKNWQSYLSNYYLLERNSFYNKELNKIKYRKTINNSPFLSDTRRSIYFLSIIYLCNFLNKKSDLCLLKLIETIPDTSKKEEMKSLFSLLETHTHFKNLFNLRDKYISHRDKNWFNSDRDFPNDVFEMFLRVVTKIIMKVFKYHSIHFKIKNYNAEKESIYKLFEKLNG